ncbi:MAG: ABC transporter permease, partial [Chitinophagales bacterium]
MLKNYFTIAIRKLVRNKIFSAINIFGLAIGIATCLLIMMYVTDELSYDRYNKKSDRIYRVVLKGSIGGQKVNEANVMPPTAHALLNDYPEVEEATRLSGGGTGILFWDEKKFAAEPIVLVDSNFFQVFDIPFVKGDPAKALIEPNTVVISRALANNYFGNKEPIGKVLTNKAWNVFFKVTGVFDKVPSNTHFHANLFASMASRKEARSTSWMESGYYTYLVLRKGYEYKKLQAKMPQVVEKYIGPQLQQGMGMTLSQFKKNGNELGFFLQPLASIHLYSTDMNPQTELEPGGNLQYVYIFGAIAIFMLVIACINFMNLSTASASKRAREVGIRKVLGSMRSELIRQFIFESTLIAFIALLLAVVLVLLATPLFNDLSGKRLHLNLSISSFTIPALCAVGLITGLLAGSYPAFFLSAFQPVKVLKGFFSTDRKSVGLRSGLVVFQFFISIFLIIGTLVVYQQLQYIQHKKLGYDKSHVLIIDQPWQLGKSETAFYEDLLRDPRIQNISFSPYLPAGPSDGNNFFVYTKQKEDQVRTLRYEVDYNYIPTLAIDMASGRNFSKDFATDSMACILNETAVRILDLGPNPLGKTVTRTMDNDRLTFHVIGVVKDFHFKSLHEQISPLVMTLTHFGGSMIMKTGTDDIAGLLSSIQKKWDEFKVEAPLSYSFLNERYMDT